MMPVSACGRSAAALFFLSAGPISWSQNPVEALPIGQSAKTESTKDSGAAGSEAAAETRAFLGVHLVEIPDAVRHQLPENARNGLQVELLAPDSSAMKAGLKEFDILLRVDDQRILTFDQLVELLKMRRPGEHVSLEIFRAGKSESFQATLGSAPASKMERENIAKDRKRAGAERLLDVLEKYPDLTATYPDLLGRVLRDLGADSAGKDIRAIVGLIQASDAEGQVEIRQMGKEKIAKLTDANGKVQFEGPITTEQQRNSLEVNILARITKVEKSLQMATEGKMGN